MVTPRYGSVTVDLYGQDTTPLVTVDSPERSVEHELIGREPELQDMGPGLDEIRVRGECSEQTASAIDELRGEITVRTGRWQGTAFVDNTSTDPLEKRYEGKKVYRYTLSLTEVQ